MSKKKVAPVKKAAKAKTQRKTRSKATKAPAAEVNVITDSRGVKFNSELHASMENGTPHADSAGNFIEKASHYDGAKKAHYGDTYRHA